MPEETMSFNIEWLSLPKAEFKMLVMIADLGKNIGNGSDMCRYFNCSPQSATKRRFYNALKSLCDKGIITHSKIGNKHVAEFRNEIPERDKIVLERKYVTEIRQHNYTRSVAWEVVLKVYIWLCNNGIAQFTNREIENDLKVSESTISEAKNVLKDLGAIEIEYVSKVNGENIYRCGQIANLSAFWNDV